MRKTRPSGNAHATAATHTFQHRNLPMLLLQTRESIMRLFRPLLREHSVTEQQWRVIRAVDEQGEIELGLLARRCSLHGPSLTGMVTRMEKSGLLKRYRLSSDQRKVYVELTPKARELIQRIRGGVEAQYALLEKRVGATTLTRLYDLLETVNAGVDAIEEG